MNQSDADDLWRLCKTAAHVATRRLGISEWQLGILDVEGLAVEVFLKLWKNEAVDSARGAVWITAMRTTIDAIQKASRFSRFLREEVSQRYKEAYSPCHLGDELAGVNGEHMLDTVMERLAPRDRVVLLFCRTNGIDLSDNVSIAEGLGVSPNAVAAAGYRIRKRAGQMRPGLEELEGR
jgi:DNA-directed RNA polymerase specialized sigma24 family protein